jgi:hypothetical protein
VKLEEAVVRVKKAAKRLQRLEGAVRHRLEPSPAKGRQIPIVFTQSFTFRPTAELDDQSLLRVTLPMQLVQQTIVNGAEDCYLKEASYTAYFVNVDPPNLISGGDPISEAVDFPNSLSPTLVSTFSNPIQFAAFGGDNQRCFNFQWNAQLMSTQANYLSQANNAQFLSRRSLGHASRGVRRQLYSNMLFKAGDALLVSVQPTYWGLPVGNVGFFGAGNPHPEVNLTISFFGTRGPDMVELAEDADLEP